MPKKYMGRSRATADLLPLDKTASLLKMPTTHVVSWAAKGLLEQVNVGSSPHYRRAQVEGLAPLIRSMDGSEGTIDLGTLANRANLAFSASRNVEQRLNNLIDLLGLNRCTLEVTEFDVRNLYRDLDNALLDAEPATLEEVRHWADVFFSVDETYLLLVEEYCGTDEPWKKFLDLGSKLVSETPFDRFDDEPSLRTTYGYLRAARDQMRMVGYLYCRDHYGAKLTDQVFGSKQRVTERIMGLLYPH